AARAAELSLQLVTLLGRRCRGRNRFETPRPLGRGASLLRAEVSVVGILVLTVRADLHPVGRVGGRVGCHRDRGGAMLPHNCDERSIPPAAARAAWRIRNPSRVPEMAVAATSPWRRGPRVGPSARTGRRRWGSSACSPSPCASCPR